MGKAKIRKKQEGLLKQVKKHINKFNEAKQRDDVGSMEYMARELSDYLKQMDKLGVRILPREKKVKLKKKKK